MGQLQHIESDGAVPFPIPLIAKRPLGSLIYDPGVAGSITSGDEDTFTIDVDPGQTITVLVEPDTSLQPTIELISDADGGAIVGTATSAAPGEDAFLQTVPTAGRLAGNGPGARPYRIKVSGAAGTGGDYLLSTILNAALEDESHGGPPNDSLATAQDIEASFLPLHNSIDDFTTERNPNRGAVVGRTEATLEEDFESGALGPAWSTASSTPNGRIQVSDAFGTAAGTFALLMDTTVAGPFNLNEATLTVDLSAFTDATLRFFHADFNDEENPLPPNFIGSFNGDGVAISDDGVTWHTILSAPALPVGVWEEVEVDLAAEAAAAGMTLGPNFQIKFQQYDNFPLLTDGRGYDEISIESVEIGGDWYAFSLDGGDTATLALTAQGGNNLTLQLYDASGNLLVETFAEDLLQNGSFESGNFTGWTTVTTGSPFRPWQVTGAGQGGGFGMDQTSPQDGGFVAWNGFDGAGPMEFLLYQDVTIPAGFSNATLRWQERIQWNFTLGGFASLPRLYDVEVRDPATNSVLATLLSFSTGDGTTNPTGDTGWQSHSADLSSFAGSTVRVFFREQIPEPATGPAQLEIDGVTLTEGVNGPANVDAVVSNFVAPGGGTYYARVEGSSGTDYSLLVTRNADFDTEDNDGIPSAQPVASAAAAGRQWILGHVDEGSLYASTVDGQLLRLNVETGFATLIGILPGGATEIEIDLATDTGFIQFPNGVFAGQAFDVETGAGIGAPVSNGAAFNGLEYVGPDLYGTAITGPGGPSTLRILDPDTGASTTIGATGVGPVSGLAYDIGSGIMFGIAGGGGPADFYTIDLATGAASIVGNTGFQAGSLEFGPDGALYGGGTGPDAGNLYRINAATGAATLVGPTGFGRLSGLALATNPDSDYYVVELGRGQPLEVQTALPANAGGEFDNALDPVVRLYDGSGNLVASDDNSQSGNPNARLKYKVPKGAGGSYFIEVAGAVNGNGPSGGEYLLGIKGNKSP
jgi:hypothetical protein